MLSLHLDNMRQYSPAMVSGLGCVCVCVCVCVCQYSQWLLRGGVWVVCGGVCGGVCVCVCVCVCVWRQIPSCQIHKARGKKRPWRWDPLAVCNLFAGIMQ